MRRKTHTVLFCVSWTYGVLFITACRRYGQSVNNKWSVRWENIGPYCRAANPNAMTITWTYCHTDILESVYIWQSVARLTVTHSTRNHSSVTHMEFIILLCVSRACAVIIMWPQCECLSTLVGTCDAKGCSVLCGCMCMYVWVTSICIWRLLATAVTQCERGPN